MFFMVALAFFQDAQAPEWPRLGKPIIKGFCGGNWTGKTTWFKVCHGKVDLSISNVVEVAVKGECPKLTISQLKTKFAEIQTTEGKPVLLQIQVKRTTKGSALLETDPTIVGNWELSNQEGEILADGAFVLGGRQFRSKAECFKVLPDYFVEELAYK